MRHRTRAREVEDGYQVGGETLDRCLIGATHHEFHNVGGCEQSGRETCDGWHLLGSGAFRPARELQWILGWVHVHIRTIVGRRFGFGTPAISSRCSHFSDRERGTVGSARCLQSSRAIDTWYSAERSSLNTDWSRERGARPLPWAADDERRRP